VARDFAGIAPLTVARMSGARAFMPLIKREIASNAALVTAAGITPNR
jgi:hypothetical protein